VIKYPISLTTFDHSINLHLMNAKVGIENAEFFSFHGYYPEERKSGHVFLVTAWVEIGFSNKKDQILANTVNYEDIFRICKEEMDHPRVLLETVASDILCRLKTEFPEIRNGYIRINKQAPQLGGKVASSFVEMTL
jgi:7,8-dihydroneopterin aldolase/epimerase/oxygenase